MTDTPTVTIGLPVYNGERFLSRSIESLLGQTYQDFELLISDNASTDNTGDVARDFAKRDRRIRYMRQSENRGAIANFNRLARAATGQYFKWAAADDLCEPTYLDRCVSALSGKSDAVWCHCDSAMVDSHDRLIPGSCSNDSEVGLSFYSHHRNALPRVDYANERPSKRFAGVLLGTRWCVDSYGLIRTEALLSTRLLASIYGSEKVLMGALSLCGKAAHVPELLFKQRIHPEASSWQTDDKSQRVYVGGTNTSHHNFKRFSLLAEHWQSVAHARLPRLERMRCIYTLLRYLLQWRKWFRIVQGNLHIGRAGGDGQRLITANGQHESRC